MGAGVWRAAHGATAMGLKPPRQCSQPGSLNPGVTLESDGMWERLSESHAKDILVHWPDGHTTRGIEKHIEDLKAMFVYAPDTRIKVHPVKFGSGEWTSVIGEMEGTFTKPMPAGGSKTIAPTGKTFKLPMCTVGRWKNGIMVEEYLFWDN